MTFELLVFAGFSTVVLVVLSVILFLIGFPFGLELRTAFAIAIYVFVVLLPGGMNLWIAATGRDGEDTVERMTACVRGLAMICGWTAVLFLFAPSNPYSQYLLFDAVTNLFLFIWSIWRETGTSVDGSLMAVPAMIEPKCDRCSSQRLRWNIEVPLGIFFTFSLSLEMAETEQECTGLEKQPGCS